MVAASRPTTHGSGASIGSALIALARLAAGVPPTVGGPPARASTPDFVGRLREQRRRGLPQSTAVLWERLERELATAKPLSRNEPSREWEMVMWLRDELPMLAPEPWAAGLDAALARRARALREAAA